MRILELNFEKGWRGGERQTLYNMQGFRKAGMDCVLLCRKHSALSVRAAADGFTIYGYSSVAGVAWFLIRKGKTFDVIHAQTSHILTYCVFTKWFHGKKILFTRRVNFVPKGFFTALKYRFTDKIVAISSEVKKTVQQFCGRQDIVVISDIVVKETTNRQKAVNLLNEHIKDTHTIGTIAAFTKEKDPFTMVEAIRTLYTQRQDFIFYHFGEGPLFTQVQEMILKYQLEKVYRLMGFHTNVQDYLPLFDLFALSSAEEGLGSSVLDAFINEIPVVSTDAGGLKDLLQQDRGISCAPGDSNAISAGIQTFLDNPEKKLSCTRHALEYVQQYHGMEYITQQYITLLKK